MEHQGNPNLINGFEDVIAHIRKLEGEKEILDMSKGDGWYLAKLIEEECNKLKEENKKLKEFCKRGRVAEKNSPLEEMYLREAGLRYNDDDEIAVVC